MTVDLAFRILTCVQVEKKGSEENIKSVGGTRCVARDNMITLSFFLWTLLKTQNSDSAGVGSGGKIRRESRRESVTTSRDFRRDSRETAIGLPAGRRHARRRHSRRYYVDRKRRWVYR